MTQLPTRQRAVVVVRYYEDPMTHTEDDLRAALRLLEQRTPTRPALADSGRQPSAVVGKDIVSVGRSRVSWAAPVLAAAAVIDWVSVVPESG